ncbi:carboxymuconolactone decarboxylase family protein [Nocardia callitridis]|uniref:Carboxymuconolactone decarboxylase family protein n=1 Tax=Nocardia callitridis TaxID=648753 RepID=A0ABP9JTG0_9NOCA
MIQEHSTGWTGGHRAFGDFAPGLAYSPTRSCSTRSGDARACPNGIAAGSLSRAHGDGQSDQLAFHLDYAGQNGVTETELKEAITQFAFYTGWPNGMRAMTVAKQVFDD